MRYPLVLAIVPAILAAQSADTTRARRDSTHRLESVSVSAIRAADQAPVSATTLDAAALARRSFGQDVPILLQGTPSLTSYSETGSYWGYSYIRIRGIDQSRINITLDGIPLNDPEDQVLYFTDFPDLWNSIGSVQVQRGVGTSAPGTASYGGSINFETLPVTGRADGAEVQLQGGSFGSARASGEAVSGSNGKTFYGRVSGMQSNGYRRHSGSRGTSALGVVSFVSERDVVKLIGLAGLFQDTLAYLGATRTELDLDRRSNILAAGETDEFFEGVLALSHVRALGARNSLATTVYRIGADGRYNICVQFCDVPIAQFITFRLDFVWYGVTSVATLERGRARFITGLNLNTYKRDHVMFTVPPPAYLNTGHKQDASAFTKVEFDAGPATLFADVQGRVAKFKYTPDANAGIPERDIDWSFFNPKVGATLRVKPTLSAYASFGLNGREPARSDMFAGFDNITSADTAFVGPLSRVRPERVRDFEAGTRWRHARWSVDANVFAMSFRNEIVPVGQLSYLGLPLRKNVASSWRRGVEVDASGQASARVRLGATATLMRARISEFVDDADTTTYRDVPPLLTPEFTSTQTATLDVTPTLSFGATGRFVGRSFLNNTATDSLALPSQFTADVAAHWTRGTTGISLFVNNVTNNTGYASGHVAFGEARYYVLPPINAHVLVRLRTN